MAIIFFFHLREPLYLLGFKMDLWKLNIRIESMKGMEGHEDMKETVTRASINQFPSNSCRDISGFLLSFSSFDLKKSTNRCDVTVTCSSELAY